MVRNKKSVGVHTSTPEAQPPLVELLNNTVESLSGENSRQHRENFGDRYPEDFF